MSEPRMKNSSAGFHKICEPTNRVSDITEEEQNNNKQYKQ